MISNRNQRWRYLAKTTTRSQFMLITYILFLTKWQKRQIPDKGFAHFEKTISQLFKQLLDRGYIADIKTRIIKGRAISDPAFNLLVKYDAVLFVFKPQR
jgi:hypothetical protein